jgi:nickel-type superoxide dismutase maturation protease
MRMIAHARGHPYFVFMLREANWKDRIMYAVGRRKIFRVSGDSMMPTLKDGDAVMMVAPRSIKPGDVVLANHPYKSSVKIVKRVQAIDGEGRVSLTGDNPAESTDSRAFGGLSLECIKGKAVCRMSK